MDLKLPFGGRSFPSIFTDFADLLCWILTTEYQLVVIHYADDYLLLAPQDMVIAVHQLEVLKAEGRRKVEKEKAKEAYSLPKKKRCLEYNLFSPYFFRSHKNKCQKVCLVFP